MQKRVVLGIISLLVFFLVSHIVVAQEGHMVLLAVSEDSDGNRSGNVADLNLEIKAGSGSTYIDTFPLTKIDAQLSTRFAKEVACDFLEADCSDKDFFYKIKADSLIIGGPSAGASLSVLTISLLDDVVIDERVAMTGTINSGGIIGSVGGIKEKIETASVNGIHTVLIPKGKRNITENNVTTDLVLYGESVGVDVIEVLTLDEAMYYFTGKNYTKPIEDFDVEGSYALTMNVIARDLCDRTKSFEQRVVADQNDTRFITAQNLTQKSKLALVNGNFYSAASYCFGANIYYDELILDQQNVSESWQYEKINELALSVEDVQNSTDHVELKTIQDLQTYVIVMERLDDAKFALAQLVEDLEANRSVIVNNRIAYATERLYTAYSWSNFFGSEGKEFKLDNKVTKASCEEKISEIDIQVQYVKLQYPFNIDGVERGISDAKFELREGNYKKCLFKASKVKAEMNTILSSIGIPMEQLEALLDAKFDLFSVVINKQMSKGIFPILGYSYYEYAKSLRDSDPASSLLYMEYALEMSHIDAYIETQTAANKVVLDEEPTQKNYDGAVGLAVGLFVGLVLGYVLASSRRKRN